MESHPTPAVKHFITAIPHSKHLAIASVLAILFVSVLPTISVAKQIPKRIVTKMVHYNAEGSPYFNTNASPEELAVRDLENSLRRVRYLALKGGPERSSIPEYLETDVFNGTARASIYATPSIPLFLVVIEIGEPRVSQAVALDTGSALLWVHCSPTVGGDYAVLNKYMPAESSTYMKYVRCDKYCTGSVKCSHLPDCSYEVVYKDGLYTLGEFASERFFFSSQTSNVSVIDDLVFGCSRNSNAADEFNGIFGLSAGKASIITQLGLDQFSYCISNLSNPTSQINMLILGEKINIGGLPTPLLIENSHYYINLEGISFDGRMLDIDKQKLRRVKQRGGALFDSGTTLTFLQRIAYQKLEQAVIDFVGNRLKKVYYYQEGIRWRWLCFNGRLRRDFTGFPTVTFHFDGGAYMELSEDNIFTQITQKLVCLDVVQAEDNLSPYSVIGINVQQYFYIAFDMAKKELSFRRIGCEFLWDT